MLKTKGVKINIGKAVKNGKEFLSKEYGLKLNIPIKVNKRLSRSLGRFVVRQIFNKEEALRIELSHKLLLYYDQKTIEDVLKHELVHYACFMLGKPYADGNLFFENELKKHNIRSTNQIPLKGRVHVYKCDKCGAVISQIPRKKQYNGYVTKCCKSKIVYGGIDYI